MMTKNVRVRYRTQLVANIRKFHLDFLFLIQQSSIIVTSLDTFTHSAPKEGYLALSGISPGQELSL